MFSPSAKRNRLLRPDCILQTIEVMARESHLGDCTSVIDVRVPILAPI